MNPYTPPAAPLQQPGPAGPIHPDRAAELRKELSSLNTRSFALAVPGLLLQFFSQNIGGILGTVAFLAGTGLIVAGLVFYSRMRGRNPLFSLLGLVSCLGLLILYFLPKSCLNCKETHGFSVKQCTRCGAPLGS